MAKRILLGKAGSSDHGLFVSKTGVDVVNGSNVLTGGNNLLFDSRVGIGSLPLKFHGQGTLSAPGSLGGSTTTTITHGLNYKPFALVQWCFSTDVTNGVATKMYPAMRFELDEFDFSSDFGQNNEEFESQIYGGVSYGVTTTTLSISNIFSGGLKEGYFDDVLEETETISPLEIKYAFLIFDVEGV